jgi:zinc and cadmium transporter
MVTWLWVTAAVLVDGAVALVGGLIPDRWLTRYRPVLLGFASGALLAAALLDLLPDALEQGGPAIWPWLLGGMLGLAALDWLIGTHDHHGHEVTPVPYALLASDAVHNFGDGIAIAAAFTTSVRLGIITAIAVVVHEVPEEVADYAVLRASAISKRRALWALLLVQLTAALGAWITLLGASLVHRQGVLLALAAGTFLYIALVQLMPDVLRRGPMRDRLTAVVALAFGIAVVAVV